MHHPILYLITLFIFSCSTPQEQSKEQQEAPVEIKPGAWQMNEYLPLLRGKRVGLCVNQSSTVAQTHLLDTLLALGVDVPKTVGIGIPKVFTPEHGFKGTADAGEHVSSDQSNEYAIISLFGNKRQPTDEDVSGLDVIVFDLQDVGIRFYTYISTMHYLMEVAAKNDIPFVILDRPNPNGSYVDGPFLKKSQRSFVGLHPIPIVHGLTIGELAHMINEEGWLKDGLKVDLTVIPIQNWDHSTRYSLPVKPSPNLPNGMSIALYPSLCLFEGTIASVGRGTDAPFQHIGHPYYPDRTYSFVPSPREGAKSPKYDGQACYGMDFRTDKVGYSFTIDPLIDFYNKMGKPDDFFTPYFKLLAGDLDEQIVAGMTSDEIRASWQVELDKFKTMREQYLIYK